MILFRQHHFDQPDNLQLRFRKIGKDINHYEQESRLLQKKCKKKLVGIIIQNKREKQYGNASIIPNLLWNPAPNTKSVDK